MKLLMIMTILMSMVSLAKDQNDVSLCEQHPIYCQIKQNNPQINKKYAFKLSNIIYKISKKYKIPATVYTAILMQESSYILDAKNIKCGMYYPKGAHKIEFSGSEEVCIVEDAGMSQINYRTARSFGIDFVRLMEDLEYSIESGAIVLSDFRKRYEKKETYWWTRYNTSNPEKREIYRKLVSRYF